MFPIRPGARTKYAYEHFLGRAEAPEPYPKERAAVASMAACGLAMVRGQVQRFGGYDPFRDTYEKTLRAVRDLVADATEPLVEHYAGDLNADPALALPSMEIMDIATEAALADPVDWAIARLAALLGHVGGPLEPLPLAAGQRSEWLAEAEVAEPDVGEPVEDGVGGRRARSGAGRVGGRRQHRGAPRPLAPDSSPHRTVHAVLPHTARNGRDRRDRVVRASGVSRRAVKRSLCRSVSHPPAA